nr:uncharacterized protein LOC129384984 [Dermacentor andersoni]
MSRLKRAKRQDGRKNSSGPNLKWTFSGPSSRKDYRRKKQQSLSLQLINDIAQLEHPTIRAVSESSTSRCIVWRQGRCCATLHACMKATGASPSPPRSSEVVALGDNRQSSRKLLNPFRGSNRVVRWHKAPRRIHWQPSEFHRTAVPCRGDRFYAPWASPSTKEESDALTSAPVLPLPADDGDFKQEFKAEPAHC